MDRDGESNERRYLRDYLGSAQFRIASWSCALLIGVGVLVPAYRLPVLYAAAAMSLIALLPMLRSACNTQKSNLSHKQERTRLLFVVLYVGLIIVAALVYGLYRTQH